MMSHRFQLLAGHPSLDFVNTLDNRFSDAGPEELLTCYADLTRFVRESGLSGMPPGNGPKHNASAAAKALRSARELRESLAAVLYSAGDADPDPRAIETLQRQYLSAERHRELSFRARRAAWKWAYAEKEAELPVWLLAKSAVELLTSDDMDRVRKCDSTTCRWLFLDTSRNHSRRWCDMKICGNRMKARRFHHRHTGT
jgi:predicted RNA-binding Zn ribbon-like protein